MGRRRPARSSKDCTTVPEEKRVTSPLRVVWDTCSAETGQPLGPPSRVQRAHDSTSGPTCATSPRRYSARRRTKGGPTGRNGRGTWRGQANNNRPAVVRSPGERTDRARRSARRRRVIPVERRGGILAESGTAEAIMTVGTFNRTLALLVQMTALSTRSVSLVNSDYCKLGNQKFQTRSFSGVLRQLVIVLKKCLLYIVGHLDIYVI